jgi:hypothetical protein
MLKVGVFLPTLDFACLGAVDTQALKRKTVLGSRVMATPSPSVRGSSDYRVQRRPAVKSHLYYSSLFVLAAISLLGCFGTVSVAEVASPAAPAESASAVAPDENGTSGSAMYSIPGPLRSFLRMAGISQGIRRDEVIPLLTRNVYTQGFGISGRPTEYLILLSRYVEQARELRNLAGADGVIHVSNCDDVTPLLHILGYRPRPNCGQADSSLQTEDPEKAFVTIDSGFPLAELEATLQGGPPFHYAFSSTSVPILFNESDWTGASRKESRAKASDLLGALLGDPALARLYWSLSKLDPDSSAWWRRSVGIKGLLPHASALDFYGTYLCIRGGRVVLPGGAASEGAWEDLVGASPKAPAQFIHKILVKDGGWLAAYFDVLSRAGSTQQAYFTDAHRLRGFYHSLRAPLPSANATTGAFRPAPGLLLFVTRLQWDSKGEPLVPGGLEVWNDIVRLKSDSRVVRQWGKRSPRFTTPDQLVQTMFALSRADTDAGPLQIYLALSELQARRSPNNPLSAETALLMARKFEELSDQFRMFSEFPELNDASVALFIKTAESLDQAPNSMRGNAIGIFQANLGIWQILARQGQIPKGQLNQAWQKVVQPFGRVRSSAQCFDAGRTSLEEVFRAATGKPESSQDVIIELLAGPAQSTSDGKMMHRELAGNIRTVLEGQRLVSLDTLLMLGDALRQKGKGAPVNEWIIRRAEEVREFQMPRPIFTNSERTEWAAGVYNNRHTDEEMKTDLGKVLKAPAVSSGQIDEAVGRLASFLRDILVGLNYAYYEPPGAQALHNNPLLVRAHDFAGETIIGIKTIWQAPEVYGEGSPAGGGAHLVGSLADLPRVLAELEQDFIAPEHVQALIWRELVPNLLTNAIVPRWWDVSQNELHAVALYQKTGEELLKASQNDEEMRSKVMAILSERITPRQLNQIEQYRRGGQISEMVPRMMPADTFYLAVEYERRYPGGGTGPAAQELQELARRYPEQVSWERLSRDFGVPHPVLAHTYARELLNIAPIPAYAGYASRLLAESWDSTNLYWARLADETGHPPVMLNRLVPQLTQRMVEKIFATELEDWPAVLRAMRDTDDDFRHGKLTRAAIAEDPRP